MFFTSRASLVLRLCSTTECSLLTETILEWDGTCGDFVERSSRGIEGGEGCFHSFYKSCFIDCVALLSLVTSEELLNPRWPRPVSLLISSIVAPLLP